MKKTLVSFWLLSLCFNLTTAQTFSTKEMLCDSCENELFFSLESTSFLKNNEYFNAFSKGYTGIGFFAQPTLGYYLNKKTKLSAGVHLLKYSGLEGFTQAIPIFTVQHLLTKNIDLVVGSIYSSLNHQLEEPFYRFDNYYQNNVEYGLQFLIHTSFIESDLWLSWEKFIFTDSPYQEELMVGNTSRINAYSSKTLNITLPFQILISHKGGQIDASPEPVSSIVNSSIGLSFDYTIDQANSLGFEPLLLFYQGWNLPEIGSNAQPFDKGKAVYLKFHYKYKNFSSQIAYWSSDQFIAPYGEYLFQSVSEWDDSFSQKKRELLTAKFNIKKEIYTSFTLELRANAYYDLMNKDLAYSYGLYLIINDSFFLHRIKSKH